MVLGVAAAGLLHLGVAGMAPPEPDAAGGGGGGAGPTVVLGGIAGGPSGAATDVQPEAAMDVPPEAAMGVSTVAPSDAPPEASAGSPPEAWKDGPTDVAPVVKRGALTLAAEAPTGRAASARTQLGSVSVAQAPRDALKASPAIRAGAPEASAGGVAGLASAAGDAVAGTGSSHLAEPSAPPPPEAAAASAPPEAALASAPPEAAAASAPPEGASAVGRVAAVAAERVQARPARDPARPAAEGEAPGRAPSPSVRPSAPAETSARAERTRPAVVPEAERPEARGESDAGGPADAPAPAGAAAAAGPPSSGDGGESGAGAGGAAAKADYVDALRAWIARHKRYPRAAVRRRLEGEGLLRVRFAADGRVLDFELRRSAGHAVLDAEILEMIRRASPLPPIPRELGVGGMEIVLPVRFRLR